MFKRGMKMQIINVNKCITELCAFVCFVDVGNFYRDFYVVQ